MNLPPWNRRPDGPESDDADIELELARLRPTPVRPELLVRIDSDLQSAPVLRWAWRSVAVALAAACIVLVLHGVKARRPPSAPAAKVTTNSSDVANPTVLNDQDFSIATYQAAMDGPPSGLGVLLDRQAIRGGDQERVTFVPNAAGTLME